MSLLRRADEEQGFQVCQVDAEFFSQRMFLGNGDNGLVASKTFPLQIFGHNGGPETDETEIDFAAFESAKLFRRVHVEKIKGDVREIFAKRSQSLRQQFIIEIR